MDKLKELFSRHVSSRTKTTIYSLWGYLWGDYFEVLPTEVSNDLTLGQTILLSFGGLVIWFLRDTDSIASPVSRPVKKSDL